MSETVDSSPEAIAAMVARLRYANDKVHTMPNSAARIYGEAAALLAQVAERAAIAERQLAEARAALTMVAHYGDAFPEGTDMLAACRDVAARALLFLDRAEAERILVRAQAINGQHLSRCVT